MGTCERCGEKVVGHRECSYCDETYCPGHQLPENHDCPGVKGLDGTDGRFASGFDESE